MVDEPSGVVEWISGTVLKFNVKVPLPPYGSRVGGLGSEVQGWGFRVGGLGLGVKGVS